MSADYDLLIVGAGPAGLAAALAAAPRGARNAPVDDHPAARAPSCRDRPPSSPPPRARQMPHPPARRAPAHPPP
ncbi:FAD-binding protein, partial [Pseudomonas aeruginosa]|uniref:FAD-binding protein n=1 Tax=Pseudomonas aeruginosa TaxID=287 RepID=UPI00101199A3